MLVLTAEILQISSDDIGSNKCKVNYMKKVNEKFVVLNNKLVELSGHLFVVGS